jgi:hypothetical protein
MQNVASNGLYRYGSEYDAGDDLALYFGEPQLDLIEPRGVGGRVMEPDAGIVFQELAHQRGFVSGKIVEDDVDLLWAGTVWQLGAATF